jgi:hypothetical protein
MIAMPLENMFRSVREAANNAGTGFEKLRLDAIIPFPSKRLRRTKRKDQAEQFAFEEAQLHEQLMIEQEIFERHLQEQQEARATTEQLSPEAGQIDAPINYAVRTRSEVTGPELAEQTEQTISAETTDSEKRVILRVDVEPTTNESAEPIRLAPTVKQSHKVEAIERKLSLIRQRLAAPPKDNELGIASLRAAVAC